MLSTKNYLLRSGNDLVFYEPKNESLDHFNHIYNSKKSAAKQKWLIDGATFWKNPQTQLQNLELDLNHDFFWFNETLAKIDIFEAYKIHNATQVQINHYGTWENQQLTITTIDKWTRRKNLMVINKKIFFLLYNFCFRELI